MISSLAGSVVAATPGKAAGTLELAVGPVGVRVLVPAPTAETARPGAAIRLFTELVVREDSLTLFGFETAGERALFEKLTSVSGVGPKTALGIFTIPAGEIIRAIALGDAATLAAAPGLGKKTAEKICLELRDAAADFSLPTGPAGEPAGESGALAEALAALENLGLARVDAARRLETAPAGATAEDLIKFALGRG